MGQVYRAALGKVEEQLDCLTTFASGSLGHQLAVLHDWLYRAPPKVFASRVDSLVSFRGLRLDFTADEALSRAQERALADPLGAGRYVGWYVPVHERRVAPKWLLSELTGVPVSTFRTTDALKVLVNLGIEVHRA